MRKIFYAGAIAFLSLAATSCNDNRKAKNYNEKSLVDDMSMDFMKKASEAGLTEIKAASVAEKKASNPQVVSFAKMMIADHTKSSNELKKLAEDTYVNITNASLTPEHQMKLDSVSKLSGAAFDKAYMQMMVMDHEKVVKMYYDITDTKNKPVKDYAKKNLPALKMHLDKARAISASLK